VLRQANPGNEAKTKFDSMFEYQCKDSLFLYQRSGQPSPRQWKNHLAGGRLFLAAFTDGYSTYAGGKAPVGKHFTRRPPRIFIRGLSVTAIGQARWIHPSSMVRKHLSGGLSANPGWQPTHTRLKILFPIVRFLANRADGFRAAPFFAKWWLQQHVKLQVLALQRSSRAQAQGAEYPSPYSL